jgi:hypothetical protein
MGISWWFILRRANSRLYHDSYLDQNLNFRHIFRRADTRGWEGGWKKGEILRTAASCYLRPLTDPSSSLRMAHPV